MSSSSSASYSGERWSIAPAQKMRPITEPRCSTIFSPAGSLSMRAPIIAWSESGIRSLPSAPCSSEHAHRLLDEQRIALGLVEQARPDVLATPGAPRAVRRQAPRSRRAPSGSSSIAVERTRPPPQPGRTSSSSGRARQRISSARSRTHCARWSISSSSGSSAQWMSSKTMISGWTSASSSANSRAAQAISGAPRSPSTASITPDARPSSSAIASSPQHSISFCLAVSIGSSSVIPAADLTISASGQYVMPSPYGSARPREDRRALDPGEELADQPALPHSRLAVDREDVRPPVADRARERVLEQVELRLAADERRETRSRAGCPSSAAIAR